ncbi:MAG: glycosyltransferase family 39 protein [Candidatus Daviesbacteria bacterium]|nr:glycosyltransferase family 39 protein [Candidatus Daviesbacteria bacterium]
MLFKNNFLISKTFLVVLFYIVSWFLLSFKILDVPPGINGDEAIIGYNAALITKNGYDSTGKFLPLFTRVPNSNDWKQPVTLYVTVLAFKLFGPSFLVLRSVSVAVALLGGIIIFLLIKKILGFRIAIGGLILFISTPIIFIQSHLALENIAPVPFVAFWLIMLASYTVKRNKIFLSVAGISLGVSIFSYLGMRMITPILILISLGYIFYLNRQKRALIFNHLTWFLSGIIPFSILLIFSRSFYPGAILGLYRAVEIQDYQSFFLPFLSSFDLSFLYILGDSTPYHSTGRGGMFLLASLPLFFLGIISTIKKRNSFSVLCLITFLLIPILFGLGSTIHRASRLLALVPPYIIISCFGFQLIDEIKQKAIKLLVLTAILFLILLNFIDFTKDYWYQYPQRVRAQFAKPIHIVFDRAQHLLKENQSEIYIQKDFFSESDFTVNFFEQAYFPDGSSKWSTNQTLPSKALLIADPNVIPQSLKQNLVNYSSGLEGFSIFVAK